MKKIIANIYMVKVWCLIGALGLTMASCIEDGEDQVAGKGSNFVRIIAAEDQGTTLEDAPTLGMNRGSAAFEAFPMTGRFLEIRRDAISNSNLNEAISVSFELNDAIVDDYNAWIDEYNDFVDVYNLDRDEDDDGFKELPVQKHKDSFIRLEDERFTIETMTVNFAAGEFVKYVPMALDPTGAGTTLGPMDFTASYGLGVRITSSPSNYKITSEGDNVLVQVVVKNEFDGNYTTKIEHTGWSAYGIFDMPAGKPQEYPADISLVTAGPKSVGILNLWRGDNLFPGFSGTSADALTATGFGASSPVFTFDDSNNLINVDNAIADDGRGRDFELNPAAPAGDNVYDPATKTIIANFIFKQNGRPNMMNRWVMEYSGSR